MRGMGLAVQAEVFTVYGLSLDRQAWVVSDKTYLQLAYVKPGGSYSTGPVPWFPSSTVGLSLVSLFSLFWKWDENSFDSISRPIS